MAETKKSGKKAKKASNSAPFYKDERILKVTGVFLLLLSFFSGVSFVSYLFTWKADQSLIWDHPWAQVFNSGITVENHLGNLGAVLSHQFFFCWFGVASFFFVV
ncbi:MAG TPA: DNA translocase FtsK 4TM domain-containing protein, partial [Chitinophagales bacterium]|nr:DNA translocase FtsK 4TM domain-containing protein [Chitinophagales bacterium]